MNKEELIIEEYTNHISVSFNRPDTGNQFNISLLESFLDFLNNPKNKILVLKGENGTFSIGRAPGSKPRTIEEGHAMFDIIGQVNQSLQRWPVPTIAQIEGEAMGAALGIVLHCDFAIASENAVMGFPEIAHGIAPTIVASYLPQHLGYRQAAELLFTGKKLSTDDALHLGILTKKVKSKDLNDEVQSLVQTLLENNLEALSYTKKALLDLHYTSYGERMQEGINRVISWLIKHK